MASVPLTADNPISQGPMQSAAQTVHIPEKGETLSGVRILVFVMELPAGGLYVTMKTSFNIFFAWVHRGVKKSGSETAVTLFSNHLLTFFPKGTMLFF
jgi:hypothetical protein